eukprot:TRINITY_DN5945_c0_g1_i1.p1 TRINITY_DN5945_c0_g1~~TRINITY_DN5945_c0_g1_i1.p1  ORF type:complete len:244 (-),score=101.68 TRINITY_DN5945_c0_g1_i1:78-809(-)
MEALKELKKNITSMSNVTIKKNESSSVITVGMGGTNVGNATLRGGLAGKKVEDLTMEYVVEEEGEEGGGGEGEVSIVCYGPREMGNRVLGFKEGGKIEMRELEEKIRKVYRMEAGRYRLKLMYPDSERSWEMVPLTGQADLDTAVASNITGIYMSIEENVNFNPVGNGGGKEGGSGGKKTVRVAFQYDTQNGDELNLGVGEELEVVEVDSLAPGWWTCKKLDSGMVGYVPANYLDLEAWNRNL